MSSLLKKILFVSTMLSFITIMSLSAQDGSNAYNFLNISSSSKLYGLGGVNISLVDDELSTSDQNPALLGSEMSGQIALNYMHYVGGSNFAGIRYAHSAGDHGAWSASVRYFGYGSMTETLPDGSIVGSFSPKDVAFGGTYSHDITDRLRGGIDIKMLYSGYADYSAFAISTDLGINYYNDESDLSLSLVAANLGGQVKRFDQAYDRLPFDIRLGWSQSFGTFPVRFSITAWNLTKWSLPYVETGDGSTDHEPVIKDSFKSNLFRHLVFGADLISSENFYIGLGYNYKTRTDMATYSRNMLSGFSIAAGLNVRSFSIGIALAQPHTGATTFMLNLNCNLSQLIN
ncbi:MAG: type IX secretion system protein PorQ [Muribaculaceae bacterium]|nr:type IX secretion system protein PorQ [Muribaculaceae bacterium]